MAQRRVRSGAVWSWFLEAGKVPLPPNSRRALVLLEVARALLSAILIDFLGYRFSTHFLMRFYIDFGFQNGVKIDQKSDFFVDCRWKCFFQVSGRFLSSFLHQLLDSRTSILQYLTVFLKVFSIFRRSRRERLRSDFSPPQSSKKSPKID